MVLWIIMLGKIILSQLTDFHSVWSPIKGSFSRTRTSLFLEMIFLLFEKGRGGQKRKKEWTLFPFQNVNSFCQNHLSGHPQPVLYPTEWLCFCLDLCKTCSSRYSIPSIYTGPAPRFGLLAARRLKFLPSLYIKSKFFWVYIHERGGGCSSKDFLGVSGGDGICRLPLGPTLHIYIYIYPATLYFLLFSLIFR